MSLPYLVSIMLSAQMIVFFVFVVFMIFWIRQLITVVSMKDEEFEGRNDKLIWFIIVFFGNFIGAAIFCSWKYFNLQQQFKRQAKMNEEQLLKSAGDILGKQQFKESAVYKLDS